MDIEVENISKSFLHHIIFRGVNLSIAEGSKWALLGGNGSGKSTLLKVLASSLSPSSGTVSYTSNGEVLTPSEIVKNISFSGPYLDVIEPFTFPELIAFHQKFKPFEDGITAKDVLEISQLTPVAKKKISGYSSGMKQRVKLSLAILSKTPVLLLDEPHTNLDAKAIQWYRETMEKYASEKTVVIASNRIEEEYFMAENTLEVNDFKK